MKKLSLAIVLGGTLAFASCTQESTTNTNGMFTQGQVDSMVDARVEELRQQMVLENDSIIAIRAQEMADSILAAKAGKTATTTKTTTTKKTTTKPTKPTTPTNTGKNDGSQGTNTGKKGSENSPTGTNTGKR